MYEHDMKFSAAGPPNTPVLLEVFQSARSNIMESEELNDYSWTEVLIPMLPGTLRSLLDGSVCFCKAPC